MKSEAKTEDEIESSGEDTEEVDEEAQEDGGSQVERSELFQNLARIIDESQISETNIDKILYSHDLAPLPKELGLLFKTVPDIIVKPKNASEVSRIVRFALENDIPVTPRGGASWSFGGAVPAFGGIIVDMGARQEIIEINEEEMYVVVEPGVSWKRLYDVLYRKGLFIGAYPSSAPGATVGGWINTGGVGIGSYKHGGIDKQIRSLEVVLPKGDIIRTGSDKVTHNASGFDLTNIFVGSEGTLGIVTKITLNIIPAPEEIRPLLYKFDNLEKTTKALMALTKKEVVPYHIGFFDGPHFDLLRQLGKHVPKAKAAAIVVLSGSTDALDLEEEIIDSVMKNGEKLPDFTAKHEWEERFFEARSRRLGPGFILGESFIPTPGFTEMARMSQKVLKSMKLRGAVVGMVVDRSTVLFMTYAIINEHLVLKGMVSMGMVQKLTDAAFKVKGRPGGFGLLFSGNLSKIHKGNTFVMDEVKVAMDPSNVMNPGKLVENSTRFGFPLPAFFMGLNMEGMAIVKSVIPGDKAVSSKGGK